MYLQRMELKLY